MRTLHLVSSVTFLALAATTYACASHDDAPLAPESTGSVASAVSSTDITEVTSFGSNPGGLKMFQHIPAGLKPGAPLVLVLHGCTETAASAASTGWGDVADAEGFAVVFPEQETINNPVRCFNWAGEYGDPSDIQRGKGENLSIKQMVDKAVADHGSDPKRVFVVGFSAGGGTAAIMTATYPDVFAGGAILAGIPYDCTTTYSEVSGCQSPGKTKSAADWAALVKAADPGFAGPWPRMSIWQGSADTTVGTANRMELVKQWTGVHGIDGVTPANDTIDGQSHASYKDSTGKVLVETYEIAGMPHAVPVQPSTMCGAANQYAIDKGICAARHIATFFGITAASLTDAGASGGDAKAPGASSGAATSSSSTSSSSSSGGEGTSGNAADPAGEGGARAGSTCTFAPSTSSSAWPFALALVALTAALSRKRSR